MRGTASAFLCKEVRKELVPYGQGELSLPKTQRVYAHLSQCGFCRAASVGSRTLRAGAIATLGTALLFFYGIYLPSLRTASSSAASAHPAHGSIVSFLGQPGAAYYVRLHVANLATGEGTLARILTEFPVLQAKGPYTGRYCIQATPEQLTTLMHRLGEVGDLETTSVGNRPWWFEDTSEPNTCSVMLDLLPSQQRR